VIKDSKLKLQLDRANFKLTVEIPFILILISSFDFFHLLNFHSIINSSGSCSRSIVFSQVSISNFSSFSAPFFIGRKHFSAGANIFHGPQIFLFRRKGWAQTFLSKARTFLTGRKHFHLSARSWRKVFKVRLFSKQSVRGAK
jgi:hypothetical protein